MILAINCSSVELNSIMYVIKSIMTVIMIIAPITAIISFAITLTKMMANPDDQKPKRKWQNTMKALLLIFFIPLFVNVLMFALGENTDISSCYISSSKIDPSSSYVAVDDDGKSHIVTDDDYSDGEVRQLDFSCKSNYVANFSCSTIHIVEHHYLDFNYYTKESVVAQAGGFDKWVYNLGGFFRKYYNREVEKPTKAMKFQEISEYVFGLLYIHGVDYYNGTTMDNYDDDTKYCKWGGNKCVFLKDIAEAKEKGEEFDYPSGSQDAFYPGTMMYADNGTFGARNFDKNIAGLNMTTNCNNTVDMVYVKAKILGTSEKPYLSASYSAQVADKSNKVISDFKDLQIGDILHFFDQEVDSSNPSTWSGWKHVAYVGEIDYKNDIVTVYDGGSYFMLNRNHKWTFSRKQTTKELGGFKGWGAVRVVDLG